MIIDPSKHSHQDYRLYTAKGAVASVLEAMQVGEVLSIDGFLDASGQEMPIVRMQSIIAAVRGSRTFQTRRVNGGYATIRRLA